jgi:superfamily II DNA or RNA helicase
MNTTFDFSKLIGPQPEHAVRLMSSLYINGVAADLSETGCGKSYVGAWIAKYFNSPVVIVCPKVVISSWHKVLAEFGIKAHVVINYEKLTRGNSPYLSFRNGRDNNPDDYQIKFPANALVIVDECHKCKAWNSKNSDFLIALRKHNYKLLMLSATSATNPLEMKSFGFATTLHNLVNYRNFITDAGAYTSRFGGYQIDIGSRRTIEAMGEIHNRLFNVYNIASRMTRQMFDKIFPDNHVMAECFDIGAANTIKLNRVYEQMEAELASLEESSANYSSHHFAVMTRARRMAELLKVTTMVEMIQDWFDEGISPVVFVNFTDTVEAIEKQLNKNSKFHGLIGKIVGGQSDKIRNSDIDKFQSDNKRIMIVNIQAGNSGVSLHDLNGKFPRGSIISPSWSAINMLQALGRCHRAEGKTKCIQKIFFADNSIEVDICKRVQSRFNALDALNDGDLTFSLSIKF